MSRQVPSIETISPDIPNPFEGEDNTSESFSPPEPSTITNTLPQIHDDTQIHRYTGNIGDSETKETQETKDVLPLIFFSVKPDIVHWIPNKEGDNNRCMFNVCRLLKTVEREINRSLELKELRQMFDYWATEANRYFRPNKSNEDYFAEFVTIFDSTKFAHDESPLIAAYKLALKSPPPPGHEKLGTKDFKLLAGVCYQMHLLFGGPFYLSCRKAAEILGGVAFKQFSIRLKYLVRIGILRLVEKGGPKNYKASTYEYILTDQPDIKRINAK